MAVTPVFNKQKTMMVLKNEAAFGTAETLATADNNIKWTPGSISFDPNFEQFLFWYASGGHTMSQGTMGKRKCTIKAQAPYIIGSAAGTPANLGKAFKACGLAQAISAATSVTYNPDPTKDQGNGVNATIGIYLIPTSGNVVIVTVKGAMGDCDFYFDKSGMPLLCDFTFTGALVSIADGALLALDSPDAGYAPGLIGGTLTRNSVEQRVSKYKLALGNTVGMDDEDFSDSANTGYAAACITKREPKIMMDPKMQLIAVDPVWTHLAASTPEPIVLTTAADNSMKSVFTASLAQLDGNLKAGSRGEMYTYDETFNLLTTSTAGDEFSIVEEAA